ncbi:hypothetical protein FKW77_001712 [Venturia effusa]|uniref:Uncharacterized protein n=1 Tax=Venturia effusa TaxID=50376 RepID=A0A517LDE8_9PEZI|nr:hypothetical protein FKW77_001712 [Venturia effusa]
MSTTSLSFEHPALTTLTDLLDSTLRAGHHLRQDIGLYVLDQKYFTKLLKGRVNVLRRDFIMLTRSELDNVQRAVQMRVLPALNALEQEAEVHLEALKELVLIAGALEEADDDEERAKERSDGENVLQLEENQELQHVINSGVENGTAEIMARTPSMITGTEDLTIAINDVLRIWGAGGGLINHNADDSDDSGLGSSVESSPESQPARTDPIPPLVTGGPEDLMIAPRDATEQDSPITAEAAAMETPLVEDSDDAVASTVQEDATDNETEMGGNEDEEYDADIETDDERPATAAASVTEPAVHPYSRQNLVPTVPRMSMRTPSLPRFDSSAMPGTAAFVRRQTAWIDARMAAEEA